jgi:hypothetical protein
MKKKKSKYVFATLTERIEKAKQQLERLEKFQQYEHYFSNVKGKTRCCYMVEMRKVIYKELIEAGLSLIECSMILHVTHPALVSMNKLPSTKYVNKEVLTNYQDWLKDEVYPYTYFNNVSIGYQRSLKAGEALDKEWGLEKPYNLCSIYKYHND